MARNLHLDRHQAISCRAVTDLAVIIAASRIDTTVATKDGRVLTFYYATGSKTHPDWGVHCGVVEYTPPAK